MTEIVPTTCEKMFALVRSRTAASAALLLSWKTFALAAFCVAVICQIYVWRSNKSELARLAVSRYYACANSPDQQSLYTAKTYIRAREKNYVRDHKSVFPFFVDATQLSAETTWVTCLDCYIHCLLINAALMSAVRRCVQSYYVQHPPALVLAADLRHSMNDSLTPTDADRVYTSFVSQIHYLCEDYIRLGKVVDGGWDICVVPPYQLSRPCLVYSFGINNDFSFDDAMSNKFGCTIRAFDPSMKRADHRRDANIWFYQLGLGAKDSKTEQGWTIKTLESIVNMLNDTAKTIDYLKMDIEGSEWVSLDEMFTSSILNRVKQLALEIHTLPIGTTNATIFYEQYQTLKTLEDFGFRRWYWHFNHHGTYMYQKQPRSCCYELVYINTMFL